jgi:hypothetical protein
LKTTDLMQLRNVSHNLFYHIPAILAKQILLIHNRL